jgi:hypothetical protein
MADGFGKCGASIVRPRLSSRTSSRLAVANKLLRLARIAIKADVYGNLIGTIAQKAVAGAANLIAHRSGGGCLIRASSSVARGLRPGEWPSCWRGAIGSAAVL